jgi:hypothetical protein
MPECRREVSPASAFLPVVSCLSPASAFRHQGSVRYHWSRVSQALPTYDKEYHSVCPLLFEYHLQFLDSFWRKVKCGCFNAIREGSAYHFHWFRDEADLLAQCYNLQKNSHLAKNSCREWELRILAKKDSFNNFYKTKDKNNFWFNVN